MIKGTITNILDQVFNIKLPEKYIKRNWITTGGVGSVIRQVHNQLKKNGKMSFDKLWVKSDFLGVLVGVECSNSYSIST